MREIAGPADFSQQVPAVLRDVSLRRTSTLQVKLASAPGSFVQLGICGSSGDHTPPVITWVRPSDGSSTSDTTPALAFRYSGRGRNG